MPMPKSAIGTTYEKPATSAREAGSVFVVVSDSA